MKHIFSMLTLFVFICGTAFGQQHAYVTFKVSVNGDDEPLGNPITEPQMLLLDDNAQERPHSRA